MRRRRAGLSDDELLDELVRLGGTPREILDQRDLLNALLPILRADFPVPRAKKKDGGMHVNTLPVPDPTSRKADKNAVEFLIHSLRKKLDKDAIRNVRGMGWLVSRDQ